MTDPVPARKPFFKRLKTRLWIAAVALGLLTGALLYATWPHWVRGTRRVTVTDKQRITLANASQYLVFTKDAKGKVHVYKNVDSKVELKWNSSDLQGELEIGQTYDIKSYGIRFGFTSSYPNITRITRADFPQ